MAEPLVAPWGVNEPKSMAKFMRQATYPPVLPPRRVTRTNREGGGVEKTLEVASVNDRKTIGPPAQFSSPLQSNSASM